MGTYIFPCIGAFTYVIKKQHLVPKYLSHYNLFFKSNHSEKHQHHRWNKDHQCGQTQQCSIQRILSVATETYFYSSVLSPLLSCNLQFKKAVASKVIHVVATMITLNCRLRCFTTSSCTWGHLHYNLHYLALCIFTVNRCHTKFLFETELFFQFILLSDVAF